MLSAVFVVAVVLLGIGCLSATNMVTKYQVALLRSTEDGSRGFWFDYSWKYRIRH
jgi:hypothetical protein